MQSKISEEEVGLAAQGLPGKKAVGPDEFPAEFYKRCPALHALIASLFNGMLEYSRAPDMVRKFSVVPPDKRGGSPARKT